MHNISTTAGQAMIHTRRDFRDPTRFCLQLPETMHQTGLKNKAGRTQDFFLYIKGKIILQLSDTTNEEEERGSAGPEKGLLRNNSSREKETGESQTS